MAVDMEKARKRLEAAKSRMGGKGVWKPKAGKNKVRVVPWVLPSGEEENEIEETVHFMGKGPPDLCAGEGCVACQMAAELMDSDVKQEKVQGKRMRAQVKFNLQILDRMETEPKKLHRWPAPSTAYIGIMSVFCNSEEYPDVFNLKTGRDFIVEFDPNALPQDMYNVIPAGSPSSVDVSGLELASYPPSVKGERPGEEAPKGKGKKKGKEAESAPDSGGRGAAKDDPPAEEKGGEETGGESEADRPACWGEFSPRSGYCKRCENHKSCKGKADAKEVPF